MSVQQRVSSHRERMRARGYRPIQIWLPDVRSEAFSAEAKRQSLSVAELDRVSDEQDFIQAVSIDWGNE